MLILGGIEDNLAMLVWARLGSYFFKTFTPGFFTTCSVYSDIFFPYMQPWLNNQAISASIYSLVLGTFGLLGYHSILLFTFILNFYVSYIFFKPRAYSHYYALIFSFSSYAWAHFGRHVDLMQIWLIPWVFLSLKDWRVYRRFKGILLVSVKMLIAILISNYLGFFIALSYFVFTIFGFFEKKIQIKSTLLAIVFPILLVAFVLLPYIRANYFERGWEAEASTAPLILDRPIEDFFTFSSRPWYHFIPHHNNPIYGQLAVNLSTSIKSTGYFLADDYFPAEHAALFYGYLLTTTFLFCLVFSLFKLPSSLKRKIIFYFLAALVITLVTLPPFFTFNGVVFYTPGYLVYELFPMFRVTARLSILLLLLILLICAEVIEYLSPRYSKFFKIFMPILLVVTLVETFVPFKITKHDKVPNPYIYMGSQPTMSMKYLVYPYSKSNESLFWLSEHKQCLMNVRGYSYEDISAEKLTLELFEPDGLEKAKSMGVSHVLIYNPEKYQDLVDSSGLLFKVREFSDSALFELR